MSIASWKDLLSCIFFSQQLPFKERTLTLLSRELTSGPEMGCRCLQEDSPFLESGRSTCSCKTQERRKMSRLRSWGSDCRGRGPHPSAARGVRTQREVMAPAVTGDTPPRSGEATKDRGWGHPVSLVSVHPKPASLGPGKREVVRTGPRFPSPRCVRDGRRMEILILLIHTQHQCPHHNGCQIF